MVDVMNITEIDAYIAGCKAQHTHCREVLAQWMRERGFATGHGDSIEQLLEELFFQIEELREKCRKN